MLAPVARNKPMRIRADLISPPGRIDPRFDTSSSLAAGPHPRRELTLMPRFGCTTPRLGTPPQRGCHAGDPGMAAGASELDRTGTYTRIEGPSPGQLADSYED